MEYGKKIFKIESKRDTPNYISFHLNSSINYGGGHGSPFISCAKSHPFNDWKKGDYLEIDVDKIRDNERSNLNIIYDTSIARILDSDVIDEIRKSQIELYELKNTRDKLIPMLNSFSQKIINEDFFVFGSSFDKFLFDKFSLHVWKKNLNDMTNEFDKLKRKSDNLQREKNELFGKFRDANDKYEDYKDKYEKIRNTSEGERVENVQTKTRLEEKLESSNAKVLDLTRRLTNSENENSRLLIRLDEKNAIHNQKTEALNNQLTDLQLESGEKGSKLKEKEKEVERKEEEVKKSQKEAGQSRKKLLTEKARLKYGKLEVFANQIGINLQQVDSLCRYCERLVHAQKNYNQANVETHESNIARVREGLRQNGVQIEDIQKFCHKCEKVAKMRVEINEIRQQQSQYEARQETIPLYNNRIN